MEQKAHARLIDGAEVSMGGYTWVVPALTFGQLKKLDADLMAINTLSIGDKKSLEACARIIHAALSRNYADLTVANVSDILDLRNARLALGAVTGQSGLVPNAAAVTE